MPLGPQPGMKSSIASMYVRKDQQVGEAGPRVQQEARLPEAGCGPEGRQED